MNRASILLLCILSLLLVSSAGAQVSTTGLSKAESLGKAVYGLGFSAGYASGIGISFRSHLPSKSSVQGVFGIIKTTSNTSMSVGAEYQYDLTRTPTMRFFFAGATSYLYSGNGANEVKGPFRIGAGLGGEFNIRESLHITLEGLFVYASNNTVLPLPTVAVHYYFF